MDRRDLFKIVAATAGEAALAQHHSGNSFDPRRQPPRFFTPEEYALLDELCETLLPADTTSGGAKEAGVRYYIDTQALYAPAPIQQFWRAGLESVARLCRAEYGRSATELSPGEREAVVRRLLANESAPSSDLERFGVRLKAITIEAYCLSPVGARHFQYEGNSGRYDFPGCDHTHAPKE